MEKNAIVRALRQSVLFQSLQQADLEYVASKAKMRQFFPNEVIVWQGKPSDSLFLITNGIVAIKKVTGHDRERILAYLMPGLTFGEVGILDNQPRSATVAALSDVDVLVIQRKDFMDLLYKYPNVAVELAKMLGRYLIESNRRQSMGDKKARLILLFNVVPGAGATVLGNLLASRLAAQTRESTIYVEYPNPQNILMDLGIGKDVKMYEHEAGYHILAALDDSYLTLPIPARTTLMMDNLMREYKNIVVSMPPVVDENTTMLLEYARQVGLIFPPVNELKGAVEELKGKLKKYLRSDEMSVFTLMNRSKPDWRENNCEVDADFEIPFSEDFPKLNQLLDPQLVLPPKVNDILNGFVDRLERNNLITLFIPTTVDVDQQVDTSAYVEKAMAFLAERFGGATTKQAQGVWNSSETGLVGETVFLVQTYVTQNDLNTYLDEVVGFIKKIKVELRQEAMALEINKKLTLI